MDINRGYDCDSCRTYSSCGDNCGTDCCPVKITNSTSPTVDGGAGGQGGTASGNNSSVCVSLCPTCDCSCNSNNKCGKSSCCSSNSILTYLYNKSLEEPIQTKCICIYTDIIPCNDITTSTICSGTYSLSISNNSDIQIMSLTEGVIKSNGVVVSLDSISIIKFQFTNINTNISQNMDAQLRKEFFYTPRCNPGSCSEVSADQIAYNLYLNGLGNSYNITLKNVFCESISSNTIVKANIKANLIAINSYIAIFSVTIPSATVGQSETIIYFAIPTDKIESFQPV